MAGIEVLEDGSLLVDPPTPTPGIKEILGGREVKRGGKKTGTYKVHPISLNVISLAEWFGEDFINSAPVEVQELYHYDWGFAGFDEHPELLERAQSHPRWNDLYSFQKDSVEYAVCNPHRGCLLALSPGLGKTVVSVITADVLQAYKVLILAPLTLARNWGKEIDEWQQFYRSWTRSTAERKDPISELTITNFETIQYLIVRDEEKQTFTQDDELWDPEGHKFYGKVTNPRAVKKWIEEGPTKKNDKNKDVPIRERIMQVRPSYLRTDWEILIVDESILISNRRALRTQLIQTLAKYSKMVILLSGSPTRKFRDDLHSQLVCIRPKAFSSYWRFAEFFTIVDRGEWGWDIVGDRPDHDPQRYLKDFYLPINQKDVLPELPDYIYNPIEIDLKPEQSKAFKQMLEEWVVALEAEDEIIEGEEDLTAESRLAQQVRMLQITSNLCNLEKGAGKPMPNASAKEDLLVDLMKQGDIEFPLLVWSWFIPTLLSIDSRLENEFKDLGVIHVHGGLTSEQKDLGIQMFKESEVDVLVLQMGVGKFGHSFTDTRTVYYHDRTFDADAYLQSLYRVKRIGLTHSPRLIVPRAQLSADPLVEMHLAGKMQSIAKIASHDLVSLLRSLGSTEWSMGAYNTGLEDKVD